MDESVFKQAAKLIIPAFVVIIAEQLYRQSLFDQSLTDIPRMQEKQSLMPMFQTITAIGCFEVNFLIVAAAFNFMSKIAFLYLICVFSFLNYLNEEIKSLYSNSLPFWVNSDIHASCTLSFGNPSSQMLHNCFLLFTLYLHAYYEVGVPRKKMSVMCTAYIIKMALTCFGCIFILFLAFSRVYLGAHSWNQVLFGATLGIALAYSGHYVVKPYLLHMTDKLIDEISGKFEISWYRYLIVFAFALALSTAAFTVCFIQQGISEELLKNENWIKNIQQSCD